MKIKLSKSQWESIGQRAGWMKKAQSQFTNTQPQQYRSLEPYVGTSGLCPVCGKKTIIKNLTQDGQFLIGTCNDAFNLQQWTRDDDDDEDDNDERIGRETEIRNVLRERKMLEDDEDERGLTDFRGR